MKVSYNRNVSIKRHYTVGAVAPDLSSLVELDDRMEGLASGPPVVLCRRRDEREMRVVLPDAVTRTVEARLSRLQWFEFGSMFLGVTATAVLMGAVYLLLGLVVEALLILFSIIGLVLYHHQSRLQKKLLGMGLPEKLAEQWAEQFPAGFALALVTVPEEDFGVAQTAFLEDESLQAPLAVDRRPVV